MFNLYIYFNYFIIETSYDNLGSFLIPYIVFNIIESLIWIWCSIYVALRYFKSGNNSNELYYSISYFAFGLSDIIETSGTTALLLLFKGACILAIIEYRKQAKMKYLTKLI